jgi:uncharacterized protein (TIGR01244 family)
MTGAKKISKELSATGQVTPEELRQAAKQGFKSVLNLRSPQESGALANEQQHAQAAGLEYAHVPLSPSIAEAAAVLQALGQLEDLPTPVLLHCGAGLRAGAIGLIATAVQWGWTEEELVAKAIELDISRDQPHLQQFIQTTYHSDPVSDSIA